MLISLVKNDLRSSYRELFPLYLGLIIFASLSAISINYKVGLFSLFTVLPFIGLFVATIVILIITIIKLFTERLYSHEGYLVFTLPVSTLDIFLSKIITIIVWVTVTILVYLLAVMIFCGIVVLINWGDFNISFSDFLIDLRSISWSSVLLDTLRALAISLPQFIVSIAYASALILLAVVFVNTSIVSKHKLVIAVVLYLVVSFIIGLPKVYIFGNWITTTSIHSINVEWLNYGINIIYYLLMTIGLIASSVWLNDHKLELE